MAQWNWRKFSTLLLLLLAFGISNSAYAVQPDEVLTNPKLEKRARDLSSQLRCLVCRNETIDDSNAPLARDLRILVRERLQKGDSNQQVLDFIVARYGEYVLLKPPFWSSAFFLWLFPIIVLCIAVFYLIFSFHKKSGQALANDQFSNQALSEEEERELQAILEDSPSFDEDKQKKDGDGSKD